MQETEGTPGKQKKEDGPLVLNLHLILKEKFPDKSRFVPGFVVTGMEKLIRQKELNEILRITYPHKGWMFSKKVLRHLDIKVDVEGFDKLPEGRRFMFASNHPLGGLDGITLIAILGEKYGDEGMRFLVNDMLMNVEPLRNVFLPVNKFGAQGREGTIAINKALESDMQILQFPAGLVSRIHPDGRIADLEWQKAFVAKAIQYERDIVPVKFEGLNSGRFYKTAKWRKKLGIKFNLEQILLPSELCKARGKHFKVKFGEPISWESLKESSKSPKAIATELREMVYRM